MPEVKLTGDITDPVFRHNRAVDAALARWANEDIRVQSAKGQAGLVERFRREVLDADPEVTEPELSRRAELRRKRYMRRLAIRAVQARQAKANGGAAT